MFQLQAIYGTKIDIFQHPIPDILGYRQRITLLSNVIGQLGTIFYSQVFINKPKLIPEILNPLLFFFFIQEI
jgi:hypothetical protein